MSNRLRIVIVNFQVVLKSLLSKGYVGSQLAVRGFQVYTSLYEERHVLVQVLHQ